MKQTQAFLDGVGDDYFDRNYNDFGKRKEDPVLEIIAKSDFKPQPVLEIGCANGWRLKRIKDLYGCDVHGIEPSAKAVEEGKQWLGEAIRIGTAESLPFGDSTFDLVIFGFCLFLCDPTTWLRIVGESDRVLKDKGYIVIYDYITPIPITWNYAPPEATDREKACMAWLFDHKKLWLAHPGYSCEGEGFSFSLLHQSFLYSTSLLKKDIQDPFITIGRK